MGSRIIESGSQVGIFLTVVFVWTFSPLPNKLAPTLHAAETVSISPTLGLDFSGNLGLGHLFPVEETHNYSLFIVHRELKMLNVCRFFPLFPPYL
jgi:hypothetical protein